MADRYPTELPGSKGTDGTSQDVAEAIKPIAYYLRRVAMQSLDPLVKAAVLEAFAFAEVPRESLQPRLSELRVLGLTGKGRAEL